MMGLYFNSLYCIKFENLKVYDFIIVNKGEINNLKDL